MWRRAGRWAGFCREALEETGAPDLLLNNAGLMNELAPLREVGAEEWGRKAVPFLMGLGAKGNGGALTVA